MRYLNQKGTPIEIENNTYHLLFTLNVIDELQDKVQMPLSELMEKTLEPRTRIASVKLLLKYLIEDHLRRHGKNEKIYIENVTLKNKIEYYSLLLINTYIDQIKSKKIEVAKKERVCTEHEYLNVEYWFYIGTTVLGFSKSEVWNMTISELSTLRNEHAIFNGWMKEDKEVSIDEAIPF